MEILTKTVNSIYQKRYGDFTITEIGIRAFPDRSDITAVQLSDTVKSLNDSFNYCPNLKYIALPATVYDQIYPNALKNANLTINTEDESLHDWVKEEKSKS